jgi:type II restriction enzyme
MIIEFDINLASGYKSPTQIARVLTEHWVHTNIYCPSCGHERLDSLPNNSPVGDFQCPNCQFEYELKSQKEKLSNKIVDGAYKSMIARINSDNNPHFFLLQYSRSFRIDNFFVVPRHYFIDDIIEKRKPLGDNARRAGLVGCNILLHRIPTSGKIFYIQNGHIIPKSQVLQEWKRTFFLAHQKIAARGWILRVLAILDKIENENFSLSQVYAYEDELAQFFPNNRNIRAKIRQQLQVLRDEGLIEFLGHGQYLKVNDCR